MGGPPEWRGDLAAPERQLDLPLIYPKPFTQTSAGVQGEEGGSGGTRRFQIQGAHCRRLCTLRAGTRGEGCVGGDGDQFCFFITLYAGRGSWGGIGRHSRKATIHLV